MYSRPLPPYPSHTRTMRVGSFGTSMSNSASSRTGLKR